jgi:hypothetical protein
LDILYQIFIAPLRISAQFNMYVLAVLSAFFLFIYLPQVIFPYLETRKLPSVRSATKSVLFSFSCTTVFYALLALSWYFHNASWFEYVNKALLVVTLICGAITLFGLVVAYRRHQLQWHMSSWYWRPTEDNQGRWETHPVLTIAGKKHTYDTPQEYLPFLRSLKKRKAGGQIDFVISQFEEAVPYFAPRQTSSKPPPEREAESMPSEQVAVSTPSPSIVSPHSPTIPPTTTDFGRLSRQVGNMQLKIRRSQRTAGITGSKIIFSLDARVEPKAEDAELIRKYKLGNAVVYDSAARRQHSEAVGAHAEATRGASTAGILYRVARTSISAAAAALSLRVTVDSLISGVHIECKDLEELIDAESAIVEACKTVKSYLDIALTFDGREEIVEF